MGSAESIAAKLSHAAAHPVLPTQGCSQARSQGLVGRARGLQRLLLCRVASHQQRSWRRGMSGPGTRGEPRFRARGEWRPGEHGAGARFKGQARNHGSRRGLHLAHSLGTNQQSIPDHPARGGGDHILSHQAQRSLWRPANPSRARIPTDQSRGKCRRAAGHPKPAEAVGEIPTAVVIRHPAPGFAGNPCVTHSRVPTPHPHGVGRPAHRRERRPAIAKTGEESPFAVSVEIAPAITQALCWDCLVSERKLRLGIASRTSTYPRNPW